MIRQMRHPAGCMHERESGSVHTDPRSHRDHVEDTVNISCCLRQKLNLGLCKEKKKEGGGLEKYHGCRSAGPSEARRIEKERRLAEVKRENETSPRR